MNINHSWNDSSAFVNSKTITFNSLVCWNTWCGENGEKSKKQISNKSPGPPHLAAVFLCATSRMLKGKQLVLTNSAKVWWLRTVFRPPSWIIRSPCFGQVLSTSCQGIGLKLEPRLVFKNWSGLLSSSRLILENHHFEFSKVPQFHGYWDDPPCFCQFLMQPAFSIFAWACCTSAGEKNAKSMASCIRCSCGEAETSSLGGSWMGR